jgi:acid phosphatase (class A)
MKRIVWLLLAGILSLAGCQDHPLEPTDTEAAVDRTTPFKASPPPAYGIWEPFLGTDPTFPPQPDYNANYFNYSFRRGPEHDHLGLRVRGEFGYARHMSLYVYDALDMYNPPLGGIADQDIRPLAANTNPFLPTSDPGATNRSYEVNIVPAGAAAGLSNEIPIEYGSSEIATVILRYYVPEGGTTAGVPLPTIEAFDVRTGAPMVLPPPVPVKGEWIRRSSGVVEEAFSTVIDDTLRFHRYFSMIPTPDNLYLMSAVTVRPDQVLVMRLKPPTIPRSNAEYGATDVRYWSVNQGHLNATTSFGIRDEHFRVASDGFVYIAQGHESVRRVAESAGYNFMAWDPTVRRALVLYRNLATHDDFGGSIAPMPRLRHCPAPLPEAIRECDARKYLGDYAPTGLKVHRDDFVRGRVDLTPPRPLQHGYLSRAELPNSLALLPPPPAPGSDREAYDLEVSRLLLPLRGTPRWYLARLDADLRFPSAAGTFSCALDVPVTEHVTPALYRMLHRSMWDAGLSTYAAKDVYQRTRPFMVNGQPTCTPEVEQQLVGDGSYPSGHAAVGWAWALILADIAPERQDQILARGMAFGENRMVCNVHWANDVAHGRAVGAAAVETLRTNGRFQADRNAARVEIAAARRRGLTPIRDCDAETRVLATPLPANSEGVRVADVPAHERMLNSDGAFELHGARSSANRQSAAGGTRAVAAQEMN